MTVFGQLMRAWRPTSAKSLAFTVFFSAALCVSATAWAQQSTDNKAKTTINQSQAIQNAQKRVDGRVLRVDRNSQNFRVKMLQKSGRVVSVDVDRQTGRVVQQTTQPKTKKDK